MFQPPFQKHGATLLPTSTNTNTNITTHTDDSIDPLAQPRSPPSTSTRRTKPPPLPISVPNWNDPPTSWTPTPTPRSTSASGSHSSSRCTSAASTTAFDINALYATASPRKPQRRRQSSMVRGREREREAAAALTPGVQQVTGFQFGCEKDSHWERNRGSVSESLGGGDYEDDEEDDEIFTRWRVRGKGRGVVKGVLVVLVVVCVGMLGVWVRGGPFTGLGLSERVGGFGYGDGEARGAEGSSSSLSGVGWGFNVSRGGSVTEFGERCLAWGGEWREKGREMVPGWVSRYLSGAWLATGESDGDVVQIQAMTQTVQLREGSGWAAPRTMSRVTRGRVFATTKDMGETSSKTNGDGATGETVLGSPRSIGADDGQEQGQNFMVGGQGMNLRGDGDGNKDNDTESGNGVVARVVLDEEAESRMARAARASDMWIHHAPPVRPIHDVGHEGREEGKSSRGEL